MTTPGTIIPTMTTTTRKSTNKAAERVSFSFNEGQAFYGGRDLQLPSNGPVPVLKKLASSMGHVVPHRDLDGNVKSNCASDILKGRIHAIRRALGRYNVPYVVSAKRGVGYVLRRA